MSRRFILPVGSFLALSVSLFMGSDSQTTARFTAEQVVEKNVAARRGLKARHSVQSLSMRGKMEAGGNDTKTGRVAGVRTGRAQPPVNAGVEDSRFANVQ